MTKFYTDNKVEPKPGMWIYVETVGFRDLPVPVRAQITEVHQNGRYVHAQGDDGNTYIELTSTKYSFIPVAGMPVSYSCWTDVYPGTVVSVNAKGNRMQVRPDGYKATSGEWPDVEYGYYPDPDAGLMEFRLNKNKKWVLKGGSHRAGIGGRRYYCDPHF
jgi:hypothetical protein